MPQTFVSTIPIPKHTSVSFEHTLFWEGRHKIRMITIQSFASKHMWSWSRCSWALQKAQGFVALRLVRPKPPAALLSRAVYFSIERKAVLTLCTPPSIILGTFHLSFLFISLCLSWSSTTKADTGTSSVSTGWRQTKKAGDTYWDSFSPASKWRNSSKGFYSNSWRAEITQKVSAVL